MAQGEQTPGTSFVDALGWDFGALSPLGESTYYVDATEGFSELSVILEWNRFATASASVLPDLNLELWSIVDGSFSLVGGTLLDQSISAFDNVEHIYLRNLAPGNYALNVVSLDTAETWNYGLAWYSVAAEVPEPASVLLFILAGGVLTRRRMRG